MIDHNDADVLAAAASVSALDPADRQALDEHLRSCSACAEAAAEYMAAAGMLTLSVDDVKPSPELRTRLMRAVYSEAMRAEATPARSRWQRLVDRVPRTRGFALAGGAAAGLVIGGTAVGIATHTGQPATVSVTLTGQADAPAAHGVVVYDRATGESTMTVTGLPQPSQMAPNSAVWEVWLVRSSGPPVAAGFLTRSPSGDWIAAMSGDITQYSAVAATNEPAGGSASPTGHIVVEGSITS